MPFTILSLCKGYPRVSEVVVGMAVQLVETVDLSPHAVIEAGERGVIVHLDLEAGMLEIKLELYHWGLSEWHNCMWLTFDTNSDILPILVRLRG